MNEHPEDLSERLLSLADRQPRAPALCAAGRAPMSFGSLGERIERVRSRLRGWGFARGDVVAWPVVDRPVAAAAIAVMPVGCTLALLDARASVAASRQTLERLRAKAVVLPGSGSSLDWVAGALDLSVMVADDDGSGLAGAFDLRLAKRAASLERGGALAPACAVIGATSGSTGRPKLVPHGHRQILASATAMAERLAIGPGDVSGHVSPLHLAGGIRNAYLHVIANGGSTEILPEMDASALLAAIAAGRITYVSASFALFREVLARLEGGEVFEPARLRVVRVASGRLEPEESRRLESRLRVPVVTGLSSSEAGSMTHQRLPPAPRSEGSVGPPLHTDVRMIDESGGEVAAGEVGEIVVRGPQVFDGYVDDDALNARAFVDGWFRTGDLGRFDAGGEVHVVGRLKDVINRGGDKISPAEIDSIILGIPGVADAACFGVPHPRLGEEVVAAVVIHATALVDERTVKRQVGERLGPRRAPRRVVVIDALPRNAAGKVDRPELARRYALTAVDASDGAFAVRAADPIEAAVAALWTMVLGDEERGSDPPGSRRRIGPDDAAALVERVRQVFGVDLPIDAIGPQTTAGALARSIARALGDAGGASRAAGGASGASDAGI